MKKLIWLPFFIVCLLIGTASQYSTVRAQDAQTLFPPDEDLVKTLLQNTCVTSMIFKGSNQNWNCSMTILEKVENRNDQPDNIAQVNLTLSPKFTWESYIARMFKYLIHTSNGCYLGSQWLKNGEYIKLNSDKPIPASTDKPIAQIVRGLQVDSIELSNLVPQNIISPDQALRATLKVFMATYGCYPTKNYSFFIEFKDPQSWMVSFDDNDGIGGRGYLLVNAYTGAAGEIKEDE
jgi:hypothetical protein